MKPLVSLIPCGVVCVLCGVLTGRGGASPVEAQAEELAEALPASATPGSSLGELPSPVQH